MPRDDLRTDDGADERRHNLTQTLISAAQRLLTSGVSYPEITVQQLANEAGIPRWRFYQHFNDKYDLLHSWFAELNEEFEQTHNAWLSIDGAVSLSTLRAGVAKLFLPYQRHSAIHGAMYDSAASDPAIRCLLDATEARRTDALHAHIQRGQSEGWIDPTLDSYEMASWIVLTGARSYQQMVAIESGLTPNDFIEGFARFVWYVLYEFAPGADPT